MVLKLATEAQTQNENSRFNKNVCFINVQNKVGVGGVERIVADFTQELISLNIPNMTFNLGRSKLTRKLLAKSVGRKILMLFRVLELTCLITKRKIFHNNEDLVIIFYHSECHLLFKLLSPIIKIFPRITTVIYLCQSMDIYPPKLLKTCFSAISNSDLTICYSTLVAQKWQHKTTQKIFSIYSPVRLERLEIHDSQPSHEFLSLIHIGRPVSFKAPEKSLEFAIKVAEICESVKLTFVGVESLEIMNQIQVPKNLEVEFKGIVKDTISLTRKATALLNLADFSKSSEVIGVAAIESLCIGIPVVIHSMDQTGYFELPGIITEEKFIQKLIIASPDIKDYNQIFSLDKAQIEEVRKIVSSENFFQELQVLLRTTI